MQQLNGSSPNSTAQTLAGSVIPCVLLAICSLVGVPANMLVVIAILRSLRHATLTVKLMLNLAVTDTVSLLLLPLWIPPLFRSWPYSLAACKLLSYALCCTMYASVLSITLMSLQRYMLVLYPWCRLKLLPKGSEVKALLGALWVMALALAFPAVLLRELLDIKGQLRCQPHYSSNGQKVAVLLSETVLGFVVPGILLGTSYLCIMHRVSQLPFTTGKRLGRLVTWVVVAFFTFWFPFHVANLMQVSGLQDTAEKIRNISGALSFFNSCPNPFLYAFASRNLRGSSGFMKKLERVCNSKPTDLPVPEPQRPSVCTQPANLTNPDVSGHKVAN